MVQVTYTCDVCGEPATHLLRMMTGRVILDGRDAGQDTDLCDEHKPDETLPVREQQPQNTDRMSFYWS